MTKARFLTLQWNNILTLALGLPALAFIIFAFSSGLWTTRAALIGLSLIGVVY